MLELFLSVNDVSGLFAELAVFKYCKNILLMLYVIHSVMAIDTTHYCVYLHYLHWFHHFLKSIQSTTKKSRPDL